MPLSGSTKQRVCGSQLFWRVRTCCGSAPVQGWSWLWPSRPCPPALGRALCALPSSPWAPPMDTPDTSASSRALSCQRALTSTSHHRPNQVSFSLPVAVWVILTEDLATKLQSALWKYRNLQTLICSKCFYLLLLRYNKSIRSSVRLKLFSSVSIMCNKNVSLCVVVFKKHPIMALQKNITY